MSKRRYTFETKDGKRAVNAETGEVYWWSCRCDCLRAAEWFDEAIMLITELDQGENIPIIEMKTPITTH
jgi:hypothetical protein